MNCSICSSANPESNLYCGHCGARIAPLDIESLHQKLLGLEARIAGGEQKFIEVDTAEKVQRRVTKWAAAYAGCAVLLFIVLSIIVGKDINSLSKLANTAKESVQPIINDATKRADEAQKSANVSLRQAETLEGDVRTSQDRVASLNKELANQKDKVGRLASLVSDGQSRATALQAKVDIQTQNVANLQKITSAAVLSNNKAALLDAYPMYGPHYAESRQGIIDPAQKKSGTDWVVLNLNFANSYHPSLSEDAVAKAETEMKSNNFVPFVDGVWLTSRTPNASQRIGMAFTGDACHYVGHLALPSTCILYFDPQKRSRAFELQRVMETATTIPDENVKYVDPKTAPESIQELLRLSGVDFVVELLSK